VEEREVLEKGKYNRVLKVVEKEVEDERHFEASESCVSSTGRREETIGAEEGTFIEVK
jgi:hypothetical protein